MLLSECQAIRFNFYAWQQQHVFLSPSSQFFCFIGCYFLVFFCVLLVFCDDFCIECDFLRMLNNKSFLQKRNNCVLFFRFSFSRHSHFAPLAPLRFNRNVLRYSLSALLILVSIALGLFSRHVCIESINYYYLCAVFVYCFILFTFYYRLAIQLFILFFLLFCIFFSIQFKRWIKRIVLYSNGNVKLLNKRRKPAT